MLAKEAAVATGTSLIDSPLPNDPVTAPALDREFPSSDISPVSVTWSSGDPACCLYDSSSSPSPPGCSDPLKPPAPSDRAAPSSIGSPIPVAWGSGDDAAGLRESPSSPSPAGRNEPPPATGNREFPSSIGSPIPVAWSSGDAAGCLRDSPPSPSPAGSDEPPPAVGNREFPSSIGSPIPVAWGSDDAVGCLRDSPPPAGSNEPPPAPGNRGVCLSIDSPIPVAWGSSDPACCLRRGPPSAGKSPPRQVRFVAPEPSGRRRASSHRRPPGSGGGNNRRFLAPPPDHVLPDHRGVASQPEPACWLHPFGGDREPAISAVEKYATIASARVPSAVVDYHVEGPEIRYSVELVSACSAMWRVEKTFTEFRRLEAQCLSALNPGWSSVGGSILRYATFFSRESAMPLCPGTAGMFGTSTNGSRARIESRRAKLDDYVAALIVGDASPYATHAEVKRAIDEFFQPFSAEDPFAHVSSADREAALEAQERARCLRETRMAPYVTDQSCGLVPRAHVNPAPPVAPHRSTSWLSFGRLSDGEVNARLRANASPVYKTYWSGPPSNITGGPLSFLLPRCAIRCSEGGGVAYELEVDYGVSRDVMRVKYLHLREFHRWIYNHVDAVPCRIDALEFLLKLGRARRYQTAKPPRSLPTGRAGPHYTKTSEAPTRTLLERCACTATNICRQPNATNEYHFPGGYVLTVS
ncbi:hypothetical protein DIPPA_34772 [Diplonema papillatum]|nr:hypothetical protein DIPPA_34772 [Diplonema papillatum]